MIRTLAVTHDQEVRLDIPLTELDPANYKWFWADFQAPTQRETDLLDTYFHFHPLEIEDCLNDVQRPKMDPHDKYVFLVTHALEKGGKETGEVDLFLSGTFLVTFHFNRMREIDEAWERIQTRTVRESMDTGPVTAAYLVLDALVDEYFPCVFGIEDELADLEEKGGRESVDLLLSQVFELRSRLLKLHHTIVPMRDLLYRIINSQHIESSQEKEYRVYFTDIYDHLLKLSEMIESNREMTADLRDSYISLNSNRMNGIMKTLTVITTVFMPLTLIAGIYGMNFDNMPELHLKYGYFIVLGAMVFLGGAMMGWFWRRGWFK
ncbi:magnesium/cobalt transporter CorA [Saccharibacillus sp. CPCC 101409]|uniref:magnesium/cobalt transporter CorA n=1 Tax=Saccharibacillus sp. CPCC 101409 TaxID=3058041 RepID=UPI002671B3DB|nr:magnesium/cobalt transporter CorA [Saccharibacillus sp. CPCC 101409]MDO3412573.1 magnesium/cobalt transporter CorA [Saccharibacillus sp. CPCC 101409]